MLEKEYKVEKQKEKKLKENDEYMWSEEIIFICYFRDKNIQNVFSNNIEKYL